MKRVVGSGRLHGWAMVLSIVSWSCLFGAAGCSDRSKSPTQSPPETTDVQFDVEPSFPSDPDSSAGEPLGLLHLRADLDGLPLDGLSVTVVAPDGERIEATTAAGPDGMRLGLAPGQYTIEAQPILYRLAAPWLRIVSIEPAVVTVAELPAESESAIHAGYSPGVPVPAGELIVWVVAGTDRTVADPSGACLEPQPVSTSVTVYRAGTDEVLAQGSTGEDGQESFTLPQGRYDVAIEVPAGHELASYQDNPLPSIPVAPAQSSWGSFLLTPTP